MADDDDDDDDSDDDDDDDDDVAEEENANPVRCAMICFASCCSNNVSICDGISNSSSASVHARLAIQGFTTISSSVSLE